VLALLTELSRLEAEQPGGKVLVFSAWGRLLQLVREALTANGARAADAAHTHPYTYTCIRLYTCIHLYMFL
jgi:hypothetical protein